jgi:hypothetical protein
MIDKTHTTLPKQFRFLLFNTCFISIDIIFYYKNMMNGTSYIYKIPDLMLLFLHDLVKIVGLKKKVLLLIQFSMSNQFV